METPQLYRKGIFMKVQSGFINSATQFHSKDQVILDAKYVTQKSKIKFFLFFFFSVEKSDWNGRNDIIKYENEDHQGNNLTADALILTECF